MRHYSLLSFLTTCCLWLNCQAQQDSLSANEPRIYLSAFTDFFYAYDFNQPSGDKRQSFLYNHNRHNEVNLNLGLLQLSVEHTRYRGAFALQAGTYATDNYAAEPAALALIYQASAGMAISKNKTWWIDAGILPSHIGAESAVSTDNPTLTRSLAAENSPYYEAGIKITHTPNNHWQWSFLLLNGWQRIKRVPGNSLPSFGANINYHNNDKLLINWSGFAGTDDPDSLRRMRYFSDIFMQVAVSNRFRLFACMDVGAQQRERHSTKLLFWYTPNLICQYSASSIWKTAIRFEYIQDKHSILIPGVAGNGFATTGISWNIDYAPLPAIAWRTELRWLQSKEKQFDTPDGLSRHNFTLVSSLALRFAHLLSKH